MILRRETNPLMLAKSSIPHHLGLNMACVKVRSSCTIDDRIQQATISPATAYPLFWHPTLQNAASSGAPQAMLMARHSWYHEIHPVALPTDAQEAQRCKHWQYTSQRRPNWSQMAPTAAGTTLQSVPTAQIPYRVPVVERSLVAPRRPLRSLKVHLLL